MKIFLILILFAFHIHQAMATQCPRELHCVPYHQDHVLCYIIGNDENWGFSYLGQRIHEGTYLFHHVRAFNPATVHCYYYRSPEVPLLVVDNLVPLFPGSGPWRQHPNFLLCGYSPRDYAICQFRFRP